MSNAMSVVRKYIEGEKEDKYIAASTTIAYSRPLHPPTVNEYKRLIEDGVQFDPVKAIRRKSDGLTVIADGAHRVNASVEAGLKEVLAEIYTIDDTSELFKSSGLSFDMCVYMIGIDGNNSHGLRKSKSQKKQEAKMLLLDPATALFSMRLIGRLTGLSDKTVGNIKRRMSEDGLLASSEYVIGADGKKRKASKGAKEESVAEGEGTAGAAEAKGDEATAQPIAETKSSDDAIKKLMKSKKKRTKSSKALEDAMRTIPNELLEVIVVSYGLSIELSGDDKVAEMSSFMWSDYLLSS